MNKKFIMLEDERVTLIHNMPFDPINGMGKTQEELEQMGVLLDIIPESQQIVGKIPVAMYNETLGFHYIYEDEILTEAEIKANENEQRTISIENALSELVYGGTE